MNTLRLSVIFIIMLSLLNVAHSQPLSANDFKPHLFTSTHEANRFYTLIKEIRCVVCQNQTIADSNAPLANDLREKVYQLVNAKKSNEEIKDYLVKRYGEFILLKPRFNKLTFILWAFPFIGLTCILLFLLRLHSSSSFIR
jgi:cytochrome c-type biogenesis protein CcmH